MTTRDDWQADFPTVPGLSLWLLERRGAGWDEMLGCVVAAGSEAQARTLAASRAGDEGPEPWLAGMGAVDGSFAVRLGEAGPGIVQKVLLVSFING